MPTAKFTLLGTGTSTGVPMIGCKCNTCLSTDFRDKRLRCSLLIQTDKTTVIIDTSSDFRQQMLEHKINNINGIIYTHHHFDHIGGFDDIRAINFAMQEPIDIYASISTFSHLQRIFSYAFSEPEQMGGGVPLINSIVIENEEFVVNDIKILPIPISHGKLQILGFRIGGFAYLTDTNYIPDKSMNMLMDLDVLIIDGLRHEKHSTHFCISEAIEMIEILKPKKSYLTHIAHQINHSETEENLPENVFLAFDGIEFVLDI